MINLRSLWSRSSLIPYVEPLSSGPTPLQPVRLILASNWNLPPPNFTFAIYHFRPFSPHPRLGGSVVCPNAAVFARGSLVYLSIPSTGGLAHSKDATGLGKRTIGAANSAWL